MSKAAQLAALIGSGQAQGNRNIVINGACVIDQRNNGSSFTPADTNYTVDRWRYTASQASKFTFQQNAAAVTPPVGFTNYMGFTVASAVSIGNGDYFAITQRIEGYTTDQLEFGTSNAKNVTLSFWVRSSLTGTFGGALRGASFGRAFPFTYAISSANTWEYKTVAVDGDTSGTYQSGNTTGLEVIFGLGVGSTNSGSAGAWTASGHFSATGAVSVVGTGSATWYVTGIQLEIGDVATPFEHRSYGDELARCQRYYYKVDAALNVDEIIGSGYQSSSTQIDLTIPYQVTMRTYPTALEQTGTATDYKIQRAQGQTTCSAVPTFGSANLVAARIRCTVSSGMTSGEGAAFRFGTTDSYLAWSAEL
tara:strand:+ start:732 stop:1823 length:1092 start_codon:yes stop_codon:yes gene_type:complete